MENKSFIIIHPIDNVAIALSEIPQGFRTLLGNVKEACGATTFFRKRARV